MTEPGRSSYEARKQGEEGTALITHVMFRPVLLGVPAVRLYNGNSACSPMSQVRSAPTRIS